MNVRVPSLSTRFSVQPVRRPEGARYVVVDNIEGRHVSLLFGSRAEAVTAREERIAREAKRLKILRRPCMCCGASFDSEGIHNRLCKLCRDGGLGREFDGPGQSAIISPGRR